MIGIGHFVTVLLYWCLKWTTASTRPMRVVFPSIFRTVPRFWQDYSRRDENGWLWGALAIAQPSSWPKITPAYTRSGHTLPDESTSLCTVMMQSKDLLPTWSPISTRDTLLSRSEYSVVVRLRRPATTCDWLQDCTSPGYHIGLDVGLATELHKK